MLFVSKASVESGVIDSYDLKKQIEPVKNCRTVTKHDMKFNNATPHMEVDPELFVSFAPSPGSATYGDKDANGWFVDCRGRWKTVQGWRSYKCTIGAAVFPFLILFTLYIIQCLVMGGKEYM